MQTHIWSKSEAAKAYEERQSRAFELYRTNDEFRATVNTAIAEMYASSDAAKRGERAAITASSVHLNQYLSDFAIGYANDEFVGDKLISAVPVSNRSDSFVKHDKRNTFAAPDDALNGPRGVANEVNRTYTPDNYSVVDRALQEYVDNEVMKNADEAFMELIGNVMDLTDKLMLRREMRAATLLTTAANYSGNTLSLAGSEWNSGALSNGAYAGGTPINTIRTGIAALFGGGRGFTRMFSSLDVFNVLSNHAHIRGLFPASAEGVATAQQIARYFMVDEYVVGRARQDTANIGQTASYSRIWGNSLGIVRVAAAPSRTKVAGFASRFHMREDPVITNWIDPSVGKSGGHYYKVGISEDLKVTAADTGYLFTGVMT